MKHIHSIYFFLIIVGLLLYACDSKEEKTQGKEESKQVGEARRNTDKPNVIILYTDDQGSIDMNCYGAEDLHTPNMDRIAETGVRFTQFYAMSPVCSPSRAALLSGKTP